MTEPFQTLISAAIRAPSGDNTQPWSFVVDAEEKTLAFHVDESRDRSPMNAGGRMSRMAVGAALENTLLAAACKSWKLEFDEPQDGAVAIVRIINHEDNDQEVDLAIAARETNRHRYDQSPISASTLARLTKATPKLDGTFTHWITASERLKSLAALVGGADALVFGNSSFRRAFLDNVRFDRPWDNEVDQGLSVASLELPPHERLALPLLGSVPDWLFRALGGRLQCKLKAQQLLMSSSGVCLITDTEGTQQSELAVGRALQRSWLALTRKGLAAQPMMSLLILENAQRQGCDDLLARRDRTAARTLVGQFHEWTSEATNGEPAFILRFGFAPVPSVRTQRLPSTACTTVRKDAARLIRHEHDATTRP